MWSSSPYDGAPPFIWGLEISFTSPTLDGPVANSTGNWSLFANSGRGPARGSALDGRLEPFQRRGHPDLELVGVPVVATQRDRCEQLADQGQLLRHRSTVHDLGAGALCAELVDPPGTTRLGVPGQRLLRLEVG